MWGETRQDRLPLFDYRIYTYFCCALFGPFIEGLGNKMNPLVLSTLPHYLAILPVRKNIAYSSVIFTSATLSVLWHMNNEKRDALFYLDHVAALVWFFYDIKLSYDTPYFLRILLLNAAIFSTNQLISSDHYVLQHSAWHLLSSLKAFYVSILQV